MKKQLALAASLLMLSGVHPVEAATQAKSGTKCAKVGISQTVGSKKFTCVKSGSKLVWNKGVSVSVTPTPIPTTSASSEPTSPQVASPTTSASSSPIATLVKFKNCSEVKAAGAAPLTKAKTPELYELNSGLDRDKDGVACES
jgi:hypothetical protein